MNSEKSENFSKKSVLILLMSKIGFQLKASSKRKRISVEKEKDHDGKELILSIEGSVIKSEKINGKNSLLVIPLINKVEKSIKAQSSIEALAAAELIADARNCGSDSKSSTLTIGIGENKGPGSTWTPILLANQSSELVGIKDEGERFKVDVSLRPPELDVNSDSYKTVPVEEFGAALLRGMGWNGVSTDEANKKKDTKLFPREYRLGLGATPKPSSTNGAGNKGKNKNETTITNDRDWSKKAEEFLKTQALRVSSRIPGIFVTFVYACRDSVI